MPWGIFCNRTYRRLARIYRYCKAFYVETKRTTKAATLYTIEFHSNLGDVRVDLYSWDSPFEEGSLTLSYANYAGSTVFEIKADCDKFDVTPMLGENITGHDVDLAVLELEEFLFNKYGDIDKYTAQKEKEKRDAEKRHREELKVLENGK